MSNSSSLVQNGKIPVVYQIETGAVIVPDIVIPRDSKESNHHTKTVKTLERRNR